MNYDGASQVNGVETGIKVFALEFSIDPVPEQSNIDVGF